MKDTNQRTNRLTIAALFFVAIIIIGFVTLRKPDFEFKLNPEQTLEQVLSFEDEMTPEEAEDIIWDSKPGYQFVDLRNPYEFAKGHIENAVNIPGKSIFSDESMEFFNKMLHDSMIVVVYDYNQSMANGPWIVLKQLGFENVKILLGGYGYYSGETYDMFYESEIPQYLVEEPKFSFAEIMEELSSSEGIDQSGNAQTEVVIPVRKKKKSAVEGGC